MVIGLDNTNFGRYIAPTLEPRCSWGVAKW